MSMHQFQSLVDVGLPAARPRAVPVRPLSVSAWRVLAGFWRVIGEEIRSRRAIEALNDASDATLTDLGLARADIADRVRHG